MSTYSDVTRPLRSPSDQWDVSHELDTLSADPPPSNDYQSGSEVLENAPEKPLGKPARKQCLDALDTAALTLSVTCLAVGLAVISPLYRLSFSLGYTNQLIVIGFLVGIMNLCLKRVLLLPFLLVEARFGSSHLQNYDAILRFSPFASKTSLSWRLILLFFAALPFGLSVSYKLFAGGTVTKPVDVPGNTYGLLPPVGFEDGGMSIVIFVNSTADFLVSTRNDSITPELGRDSMAFGSNLAVLSPSSVASLDLPKGTDVLNMQSSLEPGTFIELTAIVRGTVTTYNNITDAQRDDPSYWDNLYEFGNLDFQNLYDGHYLGFLTVDQATSNDPGAWNDSWAFVGCIDSGDQYLNSTTAKQMFPQGSYGFNTDRRLCRGTWRIRPDSFQLMAGVCDSNPLNDTFQFLTNTQMFLEQNYAPVLKSYLGNFCSTRSFSSWRLPTYLATVNAMYYASIVQQMIDNGYLKSQYFSQYEFGWQNYLATEGMTLTKSVMKQHWALYVVLSCQPVLTLAAFVLPLFFRHTPIDRGFGLVSILSGMSRRSELLQGASMSGELREAVKLEIQGLKEPVGEQLLGRVEYGLSRVVGKRKRTRSIVYH